MRGCELDFTVSWTLYENEKEYLNNTKMDNVCGYFINRDLAEKHLASKMREFLQCYMVDNQTSFTTLYPDLSFIPFCDLECFVREIIDQKYSDARVRWSIVDRTESASPSIVVADDQEECIICWDSVPCCIILPCAHLILCTKCSAKYKQDNCPKCREPIVEIKRVFH